MSCGCSATSTRSGGNPLAIFLAGSDVPGASRQAVAADIGLSETVFVDDAERGELRIFAPAVEMPFAGHPTVGSAWLLATELQPVRCAARSGGRAAGALRGRRDVRRGAPGVGAGLRVAAAGVAGRGRGPGRAGGHDHLGVWAWIDETAGTVRRASSRCAYGIAEDEATGSAAVLLSAQLGRALEIRQGRGSQIRVRPVEDGYVEVGGACVLDEVRDYS